MKKWLMLSLLVTFLINYADFQTGVICCRAKDKKGAIKAFRAEIAKENPELDAYYYAARTICHDTECIEEALTYAKLFAEKRPEFGAYRLLGDLYNKTGSFAESSRMFEKALEYEDNRAIRIELIKHYLRNQEYDKASSMCEQEPYWHGNFDVTGKKVLLVFDASGQGFGDQLMFLRYAKYLKKAGAYVIARAQRDMERLLRMTGYIDAFTTETVYADYTYLNDIGMLLLAMRYFEPDHEPYIATDAQMDALWQRKLNTDTFKVGLFWQGSIVVNYYNEAMCGARGIPFEELRTLLDIPGVTFYSLQRIYPFESSQEVQRSGIQVLNLDLPKMREVFNSSFVETASVLKQLDLVISCDSSMAHLAGGLGVPVWTLLPKESDFRWFTQGTDTFWYPTMRLYRSNQINTYKETLSEVKHDLMALMRTKN